MSDTEIAAFVAQAWERIEAWSAAHFPALRSTLGSGASQKAIRALEAKVGRPLPAALRASIEHHDGQAIHHPAMQG